MTATETQMKSWRSMLREWMQAEIEHQTEVDLSALTDTALDHFRQDAEFQRSLIVEMRGPIYRALIEWIGDTHGLILDGMPVAQQAPAGRKHVSVFERWLEHANDRYVLMLEMTKEDLLVAQEERRRRGTHELQLSALMGQLASVLKKGERVKDRFSAAQVEQRWHLLKDETS